VLPNAGIDIASDLRRRVPEMTIFGRMEFGLPLNPAYPMF
jgi:hypothetical protein